MFVLFKNLLIYLALTMPFSVAIAGSFVRTGLSNAIAGDGDSVVAMDKCIVFEKISLGCENGVMIIGEERKESFHDNVVEEEENMGWEFRAGEGNLAINAGAAIAIFTGLELGEESTPVVRFLVKF